MRVCGVCVCVCVCVCPVTGSHIYYLFVYLFICLFAYLPICACICMYVCMYVCVCVFVYLFMYLFIYLFTIYSYIYLFVYYSFIYLSTCNMLVYLCLCHAATDTAAAADALAGLGPRAEAAAGAAPLEVPDKPILECKCAMDLMCICDMYLGGTGYYACVFVIPRTTTHTHTHARARTHTHTHTHREREREREKCARTHTHTHTTHTTHTHTHTHALHTSPFPRRPLRELGGPREGARLRRTRLEHRMLHLHVEHARQGRATTDWWNSFMRMFCCWESHACISCSFLPRSLCRTSTPHTHTHTHTPQTRTHAHTHARTRARTRTHTRTHARTHIQLPPHTHTHTSWCTVVVMAEGLWMILCFHV